MKERTFTEEMTHIDLKIKERETESENMIVKIQREDEYIISEVENHIKLTIML